MRYLAINSYNEELQNKFISEEEEDEEDDEETAKKRCVNYGTPFLFYAKYTIEKYLPDH